jgi:phage terminase large subunit-like protein
MERVMASKFKRPHGTTANPNWASASKPTDLIPTTDDPHGRGARMVKLCGAYTITQGALHGQRFGDIMLPWQRDLIRYTFGHTDPSGHRVVQRVGLIIGKGSGKSILLAALALGVVKDSHQRNVNQRGLVLIVAAGLASAGVVFQAIHASVLSDEHLNGEFKSYTARRALVHGPTGIEIRVVPPDLCAAVGLRPVLLLIDEVHQAAVDSKDFSTVIDQLRRGMGNAGAEALEIAVTTAPAERSVGFYADWSRSMRAIRDGKAKDDSTLPVLYVWPTAREDLDLEDETQWWRGMPSLIMEAGEPGTMDASMLRKELAQAQQDEGGKSLELLLSQRMGIEPEERRTSQKAGLAGMWAGAPTAPPWPKVADRMAISPS